MSELPVSRRLRLLVSFAEAKPEQGQRRINNARARKLALRQVLDELRGLELKLAPKPEQALYGDELHTLANEMLAGQVVRDPRGGELRFASLTTTGPDRPSAQRCQASAASVSVSARPPEPSADSERPTAPPSPPREPESPTDTTEPAWGERLRRWLFGL